MKFTVECDMPERWVNDFCSFLKHLEHNGKIGHSALVGFYADGDGTLDRLLILIPTII